MRLPFEEVKREVIIKKAAKTNPKFKVDDSVEALINYGIINIDKPK